MLKHCPKYNLDVDEKFFCDVCIFSVRNPLKGMFFRDCEYSKWNPGLKQENNNNLKTDEL